MPAQLEGNTINKSQGVSRRPGMCKSIAISQKKSFIFSICQRQINSDDNDWYTNQYSPGEVLPISIF